MTFQPTEPQQSGQTYIEVYCGQKKESRTDNINLQIKTNNIILSIYQYTDKILSEFCDVLLLVLIY